MQAARAWLPALAGMTCLGLGAGLIGLFGFFVEPLSQEFGVGVATLNIAPVALLLVPGIIAPLVGRLVDVWPIRRMILGGSAFALLSLLAISFFLFSCSRPALVFFVFRHRHYLLWSGSCSTA